MWTPPSAAHVPPISAPKQPAAVRASEKRRPVINPSQFFLHQGISLPPPPPPISNTLSFHGGRTNQATPLIAAPFIPFLFYFPQINLFIPGDIFSIILFEVYSQQYISSESWIIFSEISSIILSSPPFWWPCPRYLGTVGGLTTHTSFSLMPTKDNIFGHWLCQFFVDSLYLLALWYSPHWIAHFLPPIITPTLSSIVSCPILAMFCSRLLFTTSWINLCLPPPWIEDREASFKKRPTAQLTWFLSAFVGG